MVYVTRVVDLFFTLRYLYFSLFSPNLRTFSHHRIQEYIFARTL